MSNTEPDHAAAGIDYEYVGFWVRVGATLIDTFLILLIIVPILTVIYGDQYWSSKEILQGFWDFIFNWIIPAVAVVLFWAYRQATPGKMVFRARIVDAKTGNAPEFKQWIIRYLGYYLSGIALFLGFLWVGWDKKKQGWHDKLAGTVVIRPKNKGVEPVGFSE